MQLENATKLVTSSMNSAFEQFTFAPIDYIVFIIMLCASLAIGVYFGFFGHGADNTDEFLLGGKRMKTIPIAISLVASQLSAISIMTIPAEMYAFGINWIFNVFAMVVVVPLLCWIITPVFYHNNISNCYEYLELRFNRHTRQLLTFGFVITIFLILPIFLFIPALAFAQVSGLNIHLINIVISSICVIYTMLGGIKAVVWTDVVQAGIMMGSIVLVCYLGVTKVGGAADVFNRANEGGRLTVELDVTTRATFWNGSINGIFFWIAYVGLNQSCVQRIVALPSLGHAKRSLVFFGIGFMVIMLLNCFTGIIVYAHYYGCDPIQLGYVQKPDKIMPFFVQNVAGHLHGVPGIFISSVFSAALSTMSANLNSLAGVVYFDYIKPHVKHTEKKANYIMRSLICICGVYSIAGGFVVEKFASILQSAASVIGITLGSVCGVFLLGMLVPRVHGRAAFWSVIVSMVAMFVIIMGGQGRLHYATLPTSVDNCPGRNSTAAISINSTYLHYGTTNEVISSAGFNIFDISFNWYVALGNAIVFIAAIPLSYILPADGDFKLNPSLLSPVVRPLFGYKLTHTEEMPVLKAN